MPIRTNRGRAAVYRRLWGWPMRSPNHLIAVLVVVAIVVLAVGIIVPQVTGTDENPGAANTAAGATSSSSVAPTTAPQLPEPPATGSGTEDLPTRLPSVTQTPTSAAADPEALDVVDTWARNWVNHPPGITAEEWLKPLRPLTTEEFLTEMATVEPGNIDATKVTGPPVTTASYTSSLEATVPTDAGQLAITVIETPAGWRVAFYEPAE
jgi:hypothetical protein